MKEVNRVALEEAVRCLGLPTIIEQSPGDHIYYFGGTKYALKAYTTVTLTDEIAEYLPNMKERYDIWRSILDSDHPL